MIEQTPFSQQLSYLSRGALDSELTEELAELVKRVRQTGKAGSITLTLTVTKLNARDENAVKITPKVSSKTPQMAPYETIMFSTADGDLLRDDPQQTKLDLREIPSTPKVFNALA